jgi:hypothetical protein
MIACLGRSSGRAYVELSDLIIPFAGNAVLVCLAAARGAAALLLGSAEPGGRRGSGYLLGSGVLQETFGFTPT